MNKKKVACSWCISHTKTGESQHVLRQNKTKDMKNKKIRKGAINSKEVKGEIK